VSDSCQRLFCTLCGREVFKNEFGHYPCASCQIDHERKSTASGKVYLVRTVNVWRDLQGRTYSALLFPEAK
jgi:hypothetical protein